MTNLEILKNETITKLNLWYNEALDRFKINEYFTFSKSDVKSVLRNILNSKLFNEVDKLDLSNTIEHLSDSDLLFLFDIDDYIISNILNNEYFHKKDDFNFIKLRVYELAADKFIRKIDKMALETKIFYITGKKDINLFYDIFNKDSLKSNKNLMNDNNFNKLITTLDKYDFIIECDHIYISYWWEYFIEPSDKVILIKNKYYKNKYHSKWLRILKIWSK